MEANLPPQEVSELVKYLSQTPEGWDLLVGYSVKSALTASLGNTEEQQTTPCSDLANVPVVGQGLVWFCEAWNSFIGTIYSAVSGITDIKTAIDNAFSGLGETISEGLSDFVSGLGDLIGSAFAGSAAGLLGGAMQDIYLAFTDPETFQSLVDMYATQLTGGAVSGPEDLKWGLYQFFIIPARLIVDNLQGMFLYEPPASPEQAHENVIKYYSLIFWVNVIPHIVTAIIDLIYPTKRTHLPDIVRNIYWSLGLGWITWTIWSQIFRHTILNPLDIYYQELYRDNFPSRSDVEEWLKKRIIDADTFYDMMGKLGYRDEHINLYINSLWKEIPESHIKDMIEFGLIDWDQTIYLLKRLGYPDRRVEDVARVIWGEVLRSRQSASKSLVIRAYRNGLITREQAINMIKELGYAEQIASLEVSLVDIEEAQDIQELRIKKVLEDLKDGYITKKLAISQLTALGVSREKAEAMVDYAMAQRRATKRERITKADIRQLYMAGLIDRSTAREWMEILGYSLEVTENLIRLWDIQQAESVKEANRSVIVTAYRLGILPYKVAKKMITDLGYSEEAADLILRIEDVKQELDIQELKVKIVLEDLKDGVISTDDAIQRLVAFGISRQKAELLVGLTLARKRVERRERLDKSDIKSMYQHSLVSEDEAIQMLMTIGYAEPIARALIRIWGEERLDEPRKLSASQVLSAYRSGLLTQKEALAMLKQLGYPESYAELLIRLEDQKDIQELQELKVRLILEDLKDGVISESEAVKRLTDIGVSIEKAQLLVQLTLARKRVERRERLTKADIKALYTNGLVNASTAVKLLTDIGYNPKIASMLVSTWGVEDVSKARELTTSQVLRLYRQGLIDREEALQMLKSLGYSDHSASLLLALEDASIQADYVELQQKIILEDLKDGYITPEQAVNALISIGVEAQKAQLLVQLELAKTRVERRFVPTLSQIEGWFKKGLITEPTARHWLSLLGYTKELVELLLTEWKMETNPEARNLTTSQIIQAYRLGILDRMAARNYLINLGYSPESAELLLKIEESKEAQELLDEQVRVILEKYRYDYITEEQAKEALLDLGLHPARVNALIELEKVRKNRPPSKKRLTVSQLMKAYRLGLVDEVFVDEYLKLLGYTDEVDRIILMYVYGIFSEVGESGSEGGS